MQKSFCTLIDKKSNSFIILSSLLILVAYMQGKASVRAVLHEQPEQIHLAFGEKLNDIVVTWSTLDKVNESLVIYGEGTFNNTAKGESVLFTDPGRAKRKQWIHVVTLKNLKFNTQFVYKVGSEHHRWSSSYWFKTVPEGDDWTVRAAVYGDMGNTNARALPFLQKEAVEGIYDFILHTGDMAYDMYRDDGKFADTFMKLIEPIAVHLPYMTCPGNHENFRNFTHYKSRFMMPGDRDGMFYSWNAGRAHFISISTEHYYFLQFGTSMVKNQYEWFINDLKKAASKENREKRPWIIIYGHTPMYCSNGKDLEECTDNLTRTGLPIANNKRVKKYGLENLLVKYGVDLLIWAHEHSYERTWPVYDYEVYNGSLEQPYVNPKAPVHIISGTAGSVAELDEFSEKKPEWSAFRSTDYGYGRLRIHNRSHLYFEQVSLNNIDDVKVIDSIWMVKDKHEAYPVQKRAYGAGAARFSLKLALILLVLGNAGWLIIFV